MLERYLNEEVSDELTVYVWRPITYWQQLLKTFKYTLEVYHGIES